MPNGISIKLHNGTTPLANQTGLTCLWWDSEDIYDSNNPKGKTEVATTSATGDLILDLSEISSLSVGEVGYLLVRKENLSDAKDSLVFQGKVTVSSITGGTVLKYVSGWTRPADWLAMPSIATGDHKFAGLFAVYDTDSSFVAVLARGAYTVNWGDGSAPENIADNVQAEHKYTYTNASLDGTEVKANDAVACTFQDAGDTVTVTAHGWQNGQRVTFSTISTTTGISVNKRYFIVNKTNNTFQVADTLGGSAKALTTNGSGFVFEPLYRQAIITVVPQGAGNTFTTMNIGNRSSQGSANTVVPGWLDVTVCGAFLTSVALRNTAYPNVLENITLIDNAVTSFFNLFWNLPSLRNISVANSSAVTNMGNLFFGSTSLRRAPTLNLAANTSLSQAFSSCVSLEDGPYWDTKNVANFTNMFNGCSSMAAVPAYDFSAATTVNGLFNNCLALKSIPDMVLPAGITAFTGMFAGCTSLKVAPTFNVPSGLSCAALYSGCGSLELIPWQDRSTWITPTNLFNGCVSLAKIEGPMPAVSFSVASCNLGPAALNEIYTNLPTATAIITVTGNYGTASDDPTIATAKGWTVTG